MKKFVIDTNVLINDPRAIYKFGENEVIIPFVVLQEIDRLKKNKDSRGQASREVARELDSLRELGKLDKGVPLPSGGRLRIVTDVTEPKFAVAGDVIYDHYIMQNCLDLVEEQRRKKKSIKDIILVTEDINLRIIADSLGVEVERYKNMSVDTVDFYDRVQEIEFTEEHINELYKEGFIEVDPSDTLDANEYLICKCGSQSALASYKEFPTPALHIVKHRHVYKLQPRNKEQQFAIDALMDKNIKLVVLSGKAGTGKTLVALAAGLQAVEDGHYKKVVVARPTVSLDKQHEIGFLPGSLKEKLDQWMGPIYDNLDFLFKGSEYKDIGKSSFDDLEFYGKVKVEALQYIRGRSMPNQYLLIDEAQNLTAHDIATIITRAGTGTKIVFTGDPFQIDSAYLDRHNNGMSLVIDSFKDQPIFAHVTLIKGERSELAELGAMLLT